MLHQVQKIQQRVCGCNLKQFQRSSFSSTASTFAAAAAAAAAAPPPPPTTATKSSSEKKIIFKREESNPDYNAIPTYPPRPSFETFHNPLKPLSRTVVFDGAPDDPYKPSSTPLYQTSTFQQPDATSFGKYDYTRSGNPTRTALEKQVAMLEGARAGFAFTSGMAALASMTRLLNNGEEMLVCNDVYGGMWRLLNKVTNRQGIGHRFVDTSNVQSVIDALKPNTRLVHVETPSNPMMSITNLKELSNELRPRGILLSVDATMMTPMMMRPLDLGVDIVVHSGTKFISGHADAMGGVSFDGLFFYVPFIATNMFFFRICMPCSRFSP
jgi:cystathionine beta-lyase/cystathionine gamma-synthase